MKTYPEGIETAAEYEEFQTTGVLPTAAIKRIQALQLQRLRDFNEKRKNADPKDDPTNWDTVKAF
jgi:hypothetical protein